MPTKTTIERSASAPARSGSFFRRGGGPGDGAAAPRPFFAPPGIQAKLEIGPVDDPLEREADRVADSLAGAPSPAAAPPAGTVQRMCAECEEQLQRQPLDEKGEEGMAVLTGTDEQLSRKAVDGAGPPPAGGSRSAAAGRSAESQLAGLSGSGRPLPESSRAFFEPHLGADLGGVRVHTGEPAARLAESLHARAFTYGRDVVFGAGEYAPESSAGRHLLAHELTHVVQQRGAERQVQRKSSCNCETIGRDPTPLEAADAKSKYPRLEDGDWCVTGSATPTYNCFAWSVGITSRWIDREIDTVYGDNDGTMSVSDFDKFYDSFGLRPVGDACPVDPRVALFRDSGVEPTHAARISPYSCGGTTQFESKRGRNIRITHFLRQLEGGLYGDVIRYYVAK